MTTRNTPSLTETNSNKNNNENNVSTQACVTQAHVAGGSSFKEAYRGCFTCDPKIIATTIVRPKAPRPIGIRESQSMFEHLMQKIPVPA